MFYYFDALQYILLRLTYISILLLQCYVMCSIIASYSTLWFYLYMCTYTGKLFVFSLGNISSHMPCCAGYFLECNTRWENWHTLTSYSQKQNLNTFMCSTCRTLHRLHVKVVNVSEVYWCKVDTIKMPIQLFEKIAVQICLHFPIISDTSAADQRKVHHCPTNICNIK